MTQKVEKIDKETKNGLSESELLSLCIQELDDSALLSSEIQGERDKSRRYYNTEPFGNEEAGLSKYVSSDVRDVVEWLMPQVVDAFVGGDAPIIFEPQNAEDVQDAESESTYTQYVFERQNHGVIIAATWFKDAFLEKNGIVKAWCEEYQQVEREEYKGKNMQDYATLLDDKEFEVKEVTITLNGIEYSDDEYTAILNTLKDNAQEIDAEADYHIIGYRKRTIREMKVENVPPEQFFIAKGHNSIFIKDARFCGEFYEKTRSELIEMGYPKERVMALPMSSGLGLGKGNNSSEQRSYKEGGLPTSQASGADKSRELVMIYDFYIRADFNDDGIAELRHIRTADKNIEADILENEEVDRNIYHAITPYLNSYKFFGRSVADNLMDLQRSKSQLWRNSFDNVAYSSLPRKVVSGNVDMAALMTYVQGGVIKKDPNATIESEITPFVADSALAMADKLDMVRAERSGFSRDAMGLDPSALAHSTTPVGMAVLAQSQLLTKMICTIIANSGFKTLMEHLRELILKYEDKEKVFDLTGQFMTTDPRRWRKQRSSMARVGLGYAGKTEELAMLDRIMGIQEKFILAQGGNINGELTNARGLYATVKRFCRRMGVKDAATYFQDPDKYQAPPPQPTLADKTLQLQTDVAKGQQANNEAKTSLDAQKAKQEHEYKMAELTQKERLELQRLEHEKELAELELLYRYGKDAADAHRETVKLPQEQKEPEKKKGKDKSDVGMMAKTFTKGLEKIVSTQREGDKEVVAALTRKKKITRDSNGKMSEVE